MCDWCRKNTRLIPMVCGIKIPMICSVCGSNIVYWDYNILRKELQKTRDGFCSVTGNICGTDTWSKDKSCTCDSCQLYLLKRGINKLKEEQSD